MSLYIQQRCLNCNALETPGGLRVGGPEPFCERCAPDMFPVIGEDDRAARARQRRGKSRLEVLREKHGLPRRADGGTDG